MISLTVFVYDALRGLSN